MIRTSTNCYFSDTTHCMSFYFVYTVLEALRLAQHFVSIGVYVFAANLMIIDDGYFTCISHCQSYFP